MLADYVANYLYNVGTALSRLANTLIGGDVDESLSLRIGQSILRGGFWSHVPFPAFLRNHFIRVALRSPA